jgi:uncharacterized protein
MSGLPIAPFDPSRYVGTVSHVEPSQVRVNLPRAIKASADHHAGYELLCGQVGEFVVVETDEFALLGRIIEVRLPERERLTVERASEGQPEPANPIGIAALMTSLSLVSGRVVKGIPNHPSVGQRVFSAHPWLIKHAIEDGRGGGGSNSIFLASVPHALGTAISIKPGALLGRHCAVLGTTGGGKSWTVARIAEEIARLHGKAILFDATGEYKGLEDRVRHVYLGGNKQNAQDQREFVSFPYKELSELDLFVLFQPSGAAQAPKLREALRSLKLAKLQPALATGGLLVKQNKQKQPIEQALVANEKQIVVDGADYEISLLARQINEECVFPTGQGGNAAVYGAIVLNEQSYCTTLVSRIGAIVNAPHTACIFSPGQLPSLPTVIGQFLGDDSQSVLRVSMEDLPFEHHTREIVLNAVGRYLLRLARKGTFSKAPTVALLDEAHQFLNRTLGDEFNRIQLDAFGLIAKEGRKYGLTTLLSTQRPRDIPEDVLSQMGMFIVHRLINERDRQVVEKACGSLDAAAARFLPTLGQGEAILVGADSPIPISVQITPPSAQPETHGPNYEQYWVGDIV